MKKILLFVFALIATNFLNAQATYETTGHSTDWDSTSTWTLASGSAADSDSNGVPDSNDNVQIKHDVTVDSNNACNNLTTFYSGGARRIITVINSSTLTVNGDVTNDGEIILGTNVGGVGTMDISGDVANETFITINEGSTMILSSTSTMNADGQLTINSSSSTFGSLVMPGTYTEAGGSALFEYGRYVNSVAGGWDLISSPVSGLQISSFISSNSDVATNGTDPIQYAVGVYSNTAAAHGAGNDWLNYTSSTVGTTQFEDSKGYQMATTGGSKVEFIGVPHTGTQTIQISWNEAGNSGENDPSNGTNGIGC